MSFLRNFCPLYQTAKTDCIVFKLYYRCTVLMLLAFSFVITCRLLLGYSFTCFDKFNGFETVDFLNTYCYTDGVVLFLEAMSKNPRERAQVVYPGLPNRSTPRDNPVYVKYYPWVNLFLLVLAMLFYLPHLIWKVCEGGLVTRLTSKVNDTSISEAERKAAIVEMAKFIVTTRGGHLLYTMVYVLSEVLNWFVGVTLTVWLVNFFNVDMSLSTPDFKIDTWDDFFTYNFPSMGLCTYKKYASAGAMQFNSAICQLPLNNQYGYMFLFLYAWFILLCVLQALTIIYRVFGLIVPPVRLLLFRLRSGVKDEALLNFINTGFSLGDWFLLTRLQKNLLAHDLIELLSSVQQNFNKSFLDLEMNDVATLAAKGIRTPDPSAPESNAQPLSYPY